MRGVVLAALAIFAMAPSILSGGANAQTPVSVGSKKFTESVLLGEIATRLCASSQTVTEHRRELGGSRILWDALLAGRIDAYPEYVGTLANELLAGEEVESLDAIERALARRGLRASRKLGFSNDYALGMKADKASSLKLQAISDLAAHPALRFGLSEEFLNRADGWPGLARLYGLAGADIRGLDHDLAYKGLSLDSIDVIDLYTTDPEIPYYGLVLLRDDRRYFHANDALLLYRADLETRAPRCLAAMRRMEGAIDRDAVMAMTREVKFGHASEDAVAGRFLARRFAVAQETRPDTFLTRLLARTREHLWLTCVSLAAALAVALPLGVIAAKGPSALRQTILALVSVAQTIPSLALLVFMIPLLGIGAAPAIAALFLYSLLPIVRNSVAGLANVTQSQRNSAIALGLSPLRRLWLIELPIASPTILAGIKTAAVINVGAATLGALIGAGGYGQPIFTGIRLDNFQLILEGAGPAAILALLVQGAFELAERRLTPRGLRLARKTDV